MKKILGYVKNYFLDIDRNIFLISVIFTSLAIFVNYYGQLNSRIGALGETARYGSWFVVFFVGFSFAYWLLIPYKKRNLFKNVRFVLLLLIAPLLFAWKMAFDPEFQLSHDSLENAYWNRVVYYPFKLTVMTACLLIIWKIFDRDQPFYGWGLKGFEIRPYLWMLLFMVPLVAAASTQHDFLEVYPKLKNVLFLSGEQNNGWYKLLYELSYGSDFIGIELFFRGFLVLAFVKWAGRDTILPMAIFYCTIHFGKPLGECISSFFGGLILGIVTYHTRTILGGLIVHLGIAWLWNWEDI